MTEFVQGGAFGGLDFAPLDWGATFGTQPAAPTTSLPDLAKSTPQNPGSGIPPGLIGNPAGDFNPFATDPITGKNSSTPTGSTPVDWGGWIPRLIAVALGLIIIAAGLYGFVK